MQHQADTFSHQLLDLPAPQGRRGLQLPIQFVFEFNRRLHTNRLAGKPASCQSRRFDPALCESSFRQDAHQGGAGCAPLEIPCARGAGSGYWALFLDPIVQRPRTPPFHGGNTGSNPVRVALKMRSRSDFRTPFDCPARKRQITMVPQASLCRAFRCGRIIPLGSHC